MEQLGGTCKDTALGALDEIPVPALGINMSYKLHDKT